MKIGLRTPSFKKSLKARTTGKLKRKLKKAVNPFYGKKGMGYIKNPKRAIKNKIYHNTPVSTTETTRATEGVNEITEATVESTSVATTEATTMPTTEPATEPTTEPTTESTSAHTVAPTTQPTSAPEQESTAAAQDDGITFISWPKTTSRNETVSVTIKGKPNTKYSITVYYNSGASTAEGLESKTSDSEGYVTWTWHIGGRTSAGTFRIVVSDGTNKETVNFTIVE